MTEPARHTIPYLAASGSPVARELKEAREALGISVRDMAQMLRIRAVHIEALEGGRFDELPGRPYTLGFARSIAGHLGLNADEITQRLREEVMGTAPAVELVFPESTEDKRLSRAGWMVISLILAFGAYAAWLTLAHRGNPPEFAAVEALPQTIPDAPAEDNALTGTSPADVPSAAEAGASPTETAPSAAGPTAGAASVASVPQETGGSAPAPAAEEPAAPEAPATRDMPPAASAAAITPTPKPAVPVSSAAPSGTPTVAAPSAEDTSQEDVRPEPAVVAGTPAPRVVLHAAQDSWIQIQAPNGSTVVARTLKAGESYTVPDQSGLKLTTGNAGGLEILVNGQPIPSLGQPGMVRRDIALDPAHLIAGKALP